MNDARQHLLTIGTFADAAQLSLKALRLYAQLGILPPSYVDPDSGYRYYHADQLHRAWLIRMLRQIDMPLATNPEGACGVADRGTTAGAGALRSTGAARRAGQARRSRPNGIHTTGGTDHGT